MKETILKYAVFGIYITIFPFIYIGLINKLKNIWCGRKGAPVLQPFYDFIKLLKKKEVISSKTTFVFFFAPVVSFVAVVFAALVDACAFRNRINENAIVSMQHLGCYAGCVHLGIAPRYPWEYASNG